MLALEENQFKIRIWLTAKALTNDKDIFILWCNDLFSGKIYKNLKIDFSAHLLIICFQGQSRHHFK